MRVHLNRLSWSEVKTVLGCTLRVLADSTRTIDIMVGEELTAKAQLKYLMAQGVLETADGAKLLRERPSFVDVDMHRLMAMPEETLGGALARFHDRNGLTPSVYQQPIQFIEDPDEAYLMQRIRHCHDVWHVLTGLNVQGHEEILLHAFSLAQTGLPSSVALGLLGSLKHMLFEFRWRTLGKGMTEAYRCGSECQPLLGVYWEQYFEEPIDGLRERFGIRTLSHYS